MKLSMRLALLSAANIGAAFLFQWYTLVQLGPGTETDALFAGMAVPQLILTVISASLMHVLVPILAGESEKQLRHDSWALLFLIGGLFSAIAVLLFVLAPYWVPVLFPGFEGASQALTVDLTQIQLIGMIFSAVNGVQWAAYHARQQFLWAEFTPLVASGLTFLLLVWALPRFGVMAAAWVSVLRIGLQTLLLAPGMGWPVWPNLRTPAIHDAWSRIKPLLAGTAYYKTDPLVDRFLLSTTVSGSLSLYYFGQQIYSAASQVINKAIAAPMVPKLSIFHKSGDRAGFRQHYQQRLLRVGLIGVGGLSILALFGEDLLQCLIGYGNVQAEDVSELWWLMVWMSGILIGGSVGQITSSAFYSIGDTRTPTRLSILTYTVYIPCKVGAFYGAGVVGLALVTSIYYMANLLIQIGVLEWRWRHGPA